MLIEGRIAFQSHLKRLYVKTTEESIQSQHDQRVPAEQPTKQRVVLAAARRQTLASVQNATEVAETG
jgi:hypothetical protein